ncbi:hypothetical protein QR680_010693 [Steinernema hermaphroditum]|uniref:C2 domain-containing protein n=1 Tax=Steinernema hermaphroditum TaxID=289476 RepID=A0AA39ISI2_9BILA|nr:hypothetical protein QR680_010693 [Steinernema hermaphroditum]
MAQLLQDRRFVNDQGKTGFHFYSAYLPTPIEKNEEHYQMSSPFNIFFLLFLSSLTAHALPLADHSKEAPKESFWITAQISSIHILPGCLVADFCSQPHFKLRQFMDKGSHDEFSMSWPITSEETIQNQSRSFVTFWTEGSVQDISLSCEISGIVPQHNFARICDQSNQIRISESTTEAHLLNQSRVDTNSQPLNPEDDLAKGKLLELKGRCFTATLLVQSHTESCPWCPDTQHIAPGNDQQIEIFGYFIQSDECWYILAILVLSVVTVIMIAIAVYQFVVHWRLKSQQPRYYQKASPNPYIIGQHSPVSNDVIRITGSGLRYDTEGQANSDRSSRLSTISNFTPLDSSSVKGDASPVYASIIREVPGARSHQIFQDLISANAELGTQGDSGLESL